MKYLESLFIYMGSFGVSLFLCYIYEFLYKKNKYTELPILVKGTFYISIITAPVFISTVRYGVGTDFFRYIIRYGNINQWSFKYSWDLYGNEPLSFFINKLAYILFDSELGMFFLSALIINLFVVMGLDYFKKDISMTMGLFIFYMLLFHFGLNGIRQAMAMSIVFFAFRYIFEQKFIPYILCIIIATLFHNTAIFGIAFYLLVLKKGKFINKSTNIIYYFGILMTPILLIVFINFLSKLPLLDNYLKYINTLSLTFDLSFLVRILPILTPIILLKKQIMLISKSYESLINISLLNIPFQYLVYYTDWGHRLALYTNFTYIILVPLAVKSVKKSENKIILIVYFILLFLTIYISDYLINNYQGVYPYQSIF